MVNTAARRQTFTRALILFNELILVLVLVLLSVLISIGNPKFISFTNILNILRDSSMAVKLYNKEKVPEHWVTPTFALTPANWNKYYDLKGEVRTINWKAVNAIPRETKCAKY